MAPSRGQSGEVVEGTGIGAHVCLAGCLRPAKRTELSPTPAPLPGWRQQSTGFQSLWECKFSELSPILKLLSNMRAASGLATRDTGSLCCSCSETQSRRAAGNPKVSFCFFLSFFLFSSRFCPSLTIRLPSSCYWCPGTTKNRRALQLVLSGLWRAIQKQYHNEGMMIMAVTIMLGVLP